MRVVSFHRLEPGRNETARRLIGGAQRKARQSKKQSLTPFCARYIRTNRDGTIQFLMEWQRTDREIATGTYEYLSKTTNDSGSLSENGFRLIIEEIKELSRVSREISLSDVADLSILREAQKELGIKGN